MTKLYNILALVLVSLFAVACDDTSKPVYLDVEDVNDVYIGWASLTDSDGTRISEDAIEENTIVVDGSDVSVGLFDDHCVLVLGSEQPGWQDARVSCVLPHLDGVFVSERAGIIVHDGTYLLIVEGYYNGYRASYGAVMGAKP